MIYFTYLCVYIYVCLFSWKSFLRLHLSLFFQAIGFDFMSFKSLATISFTSSWKIIFVLVLTFPSNFKKLSLMECQSCNSKNLSNIHCLILKMRWGLSCRKLYTNGHDLHCMLSGGVGHDKEQKIHSIYLKRSLRLPIEFLFRLRRVAYKQIHLESFLLPLFRQLTGFRDIKQPLINWNSFQLTWSKLNFSTEVFIIRTQIKVFRGTGCYTIWIFICICTSVGL